MVREICTGVRKSLPLRQFLQQASQPGRSVQRPLPVAPSAPSAPRRARPIPSTGRPPGPAPPHPINKPRGVRRASGCRRQEPVDQEHGAQVDGPAWQGRWPGGGSVSLPDWRPSRHRRAPAGRRAGTGSRGGYGMRHPDASVVTADSDSGRPWWCCHQFGVSSSPLQQRYPGKPLPTCLPRHWSGEIAPRWAGKHPPR